MYEAFAWVFACLGAAGLVVGLIGAIHPPLVTKKGYVPPSRHALTVGTVLVCTILFVLAGVGFQQTRKAASARLRPPISRSSDAQAMRNFRDTLRHLNDDLDRSIDTLKQQMGKVSQATGHTRQAEAKRSAEDYDAVVHALDAYRRVQLPKFESSQTGAYATDAASVQAEWVSLVRQEYAARWEGDHKQADLLHEEVDEAAYRLDVALTRAYASAGLPHTADVPGL